MPTGLCQVVANNLMAAVYNDHVDNAENDSVIVTTFRIGCAVPPLLWALLFKDFAAIVGYAGESQNRAQTTRFCSLRVKRVSNFRRQPKTNDTLLFTKTFFFLLSSRRRHKIEVYV